jgi:hypothetical protein
VFHVLNNSNAVNLGIDGWGIGAEVARASNFNLALNLASFKGQIEGKALLLLDDRGLLPKTQKS